MPNGGDDPLGLNRSMDDGKQTDSTALKPVEGIVASVAKADKSERRSMLCSVVDELGLRQV